MSVKQSFFEITHRSGTARAGVLHTQHGDVETPAFVGVATKATLKGITNDHIDDIGVQLMIANTYHLFLSPGHELIRDAGGLHRFMNYSGPLMTDSGGFQVFSLGEGMEKQVSKFAGELAEDSVQPVYFDPGVATQHGKLAIVDDDGVTFTSHLDGSLHRFTPERSVEIQHNLGADMFFAFDECTAPTASYEYQREAMYRTHAWARRSLAAHRQNVEANNRQRIYGIAQGGQFDALRAESARTIGDMGFDGFGLGGSFSKKYGDNSLQSALAMLSQIPPEMPVHGLGVGEPEDILLGVQYGVDTFDCVTPTRNGRNGTLYTARGKMNIKRAEYANDFAPIDIECTCLMCLHHTRAYVHHLFRSGEMLGPILASIHNVQFLVQLTRDIRRTIQEHRFEEFRDSFLHKYTRG